MKRIFLPLLLAALCVSAIAFTTKLANPTINAKNLKANTPSLVNTANMVKIMVVSSEKRILGGAASFAVTYANRPKFYQQWMIEDQPLPIPDKAFYPPESGKANFYCNLEFENFNFTGQKSFDLKGKTIIFVNADKKQIDIRP